jgi:histidinol-phosphate aminotransferase
MTHTFSKIHGLAALRLGWMFGPAHIVDAVNRIRGPFNVSTPAMLAGGRRDRGHRASADVEVRTPRNGATGSPRNRRLGLKVTPSVANFVLIHFPESKGKTAADADAFLTKRGLVLRGSPITACRTPCA